MDHQPAKIIFPNKQRPQGLEFPACKACNNRSSPYENVMALIARMAGSTRRNRPPVDHEVFRRIMFQVHFHFPGLARAMLKGAVEYQRNGILLSGGLLNVDHASVHHAMNYLAAKLNVAMHYKLNGTPAPNGYTIQTLWQYSLDQNAFASVDRFLRLLPKVAGFTTDRTKTDEIFFVRCVRVGNTIYSVAVFYETIALISKGASQDSYILPDKNSYAFQVFSGKGIENIATPAAELPNFMARKIKPFGGKPPSQSIGV